MRLVYTITDETKFKLYTTRGRGSLGSQFDEDRGNPRKTTNLASFKGKSVERTLRPVVNRFERSSYIINNLFPSQSIFWIGA